MKSIAIWNHDMTSDRTVITSGGNVTVIGPGAMQEFEGKLGEEVLAEAKRSGVPFSTTPANGVVVGGQVFVKRTEIGDRKLEIGEAPKLMVPVGIFDKANLMRLDRMMIVTMADCLGLPTSVDSTKGELVNKILDISGSAHVPPTETGENQPAPTEEVKET